MASESTKISVSNDHGNCGDKNCPKHGPNAAPGIKRSALTVNNLSSRTSLPSAKTHGSGNCSNKNCPKHGPRASVSQKSTIQTSTGEKIISARAGDGNAMAISQEGRGNGSIKVKENMDKEVEELVKKTHQVLRVSVPTSKTGGTNNVLTFITNNNNTVDSSFMPISPSVSPGKLGASAERLSSTSTSGSGMFDQMRMEHALKENVMLQSITIRQNEEIMDIKNQAQELQVKIDKMEQEKMQLLIKLKEFKKYSQAVEKAMKRDKETIKQLKYKLHYTDLKAKQLKRMASDNAASASKWRTKVMESLEAQKDMEDRKIASERAAIGLYRQFREEKKKIVDMKRKHGAPITESDLDDTVSTTVGTLDNTMIESDSNASSPASTDAVSSSTH